MNRPESARLLSRSAYIFGIRAIPSLAVLLVGIWFARQLPKALYGAYQQVWVYLAVFVAVGAAGIPALLITYSQEQLQRWMRRLQGRHVALYLLANLGLGAGLYLAVREQGLGAAVLIGLYLAQLFALLGETWLILTDRFRLLLTIVAAYTAAFVVLHLAFLRDRLSFDALFLLLAVLLGLRAVIQLLIGISAYRASRATLRAGGMPRSIRRQWLQLGIYDVSQLVFRYIDKLIIGWLAGPAGFAVYVIGTMDVPVLPLLLGAAGTAVLRQLSTTTAGLEGKIPLMRFTGTTLARIVFPLFGFLFCFRTEIITVLFGAQYRAAIPLFAISAFAVPLRAYNFTAMLQHLNRVRIINIGALLDLLLALVLAYPLFVWNGLPGVAVAFTVCSWFQAGFYLYHTSRLLRTPVLDLIPLQEWTILLVIYFCAALSLHSTFRDIGGMQTTLLLGAGTTVVIIAGSLYPIFFRKRNGS